MTAKFFMRDARRHNGKHAKCGWCDPDASAHIHDLKGEQAPEDDVARWRPFSVSTAPQGPFADDEFRAREQLSGLIYRSERPRHPKRDSDGSLSDHLRPALYQRHQASRQSRRLDVA